MCISMQASHIVCSTSLLGSHYWKLDFSVQVTNCRHLMAFEMPKPVPSDPQDLAQKTEIYPCHLCQEMKMSHILQEISDSTRCLCVGS